RRLTEDEATFLQRDLNAQVFEFQRKWFSAGAITKAEATYLQRAVDQYPTQFARFQMSIKAHKKPWKTRPIVCCVGTFMNYLSRWLDFWLQKLKPLVDTYLRDSQDLLAQLRELGPLPPGAKLFTADANSMYTNIDTDHAIDVIGAWLDSLGDQLPSGFPLEAVKEAMELIMKNNVFSWGDLYFLQLLGTAMGTSAACMWATIYFWVHERNLIASYSNYLFFLKRFIDDMFGIWIPNTPAAITAWTSFQSNVNNFGISEWGAVITAAPPLFALGSAATPLRLRAKSFFLFSHFQVIFISAPLIS
ncbi:hypothetical protein ACHAWF_015901, partial [Thalassiosira exigua]